MNERKSAPAAEHAPAFLPEGAGVEPAGLGDAGAGQVTRRGVLGRFGAIAAAVSAGLALPVTAQAAGRGRRITVTTHGHGFRVEDVSNSYSVVPYGWGLAISGWKDGKAPKVLWVHAVIPVLGVWQQISATKRERSVHLSEFRIQFTTTGGVNQRVSNLDIWDGGKRILARSGLNMRGPFFSGGFAKPIRLQNYALGISIGLTIPSLLDSGPNTPPPPSFVFSSAEATLLLRGL